MEDTSFFRGKSLAYGRHLILQRWKPGLWKTPHYSEVKAWPMEDTSFFSGESLAYGRHFIHQWWKPDLWKTPHSSEAKALPMEDPSFFRGESLAYDLAWVVLHLFVVTLCGWWQTVAIQELTNYFICQSGRPYLWVAHCSSEVNALPMGNIVVDVEWLVCRVTER